MPGHPRPRRGLWLPAVSPRGGWRQGARNPAKTPRSERRAPGRGKRLGPGRAAGGVPGGADRLTGDLGGAEAGAGEEGAGSPLALPPPPPVPPRHPRGRANVGLLLGLCWWQQLQAFLGRGSVLQGTQPSGDRLKVALLPLPCGDLSGKERSRAQRAVRVCARVLQPLGDAGHQLRLWPAGPFPACIYVGDPC